MVEFCTGAVDNVVDNWVVREKIRRFRLDEEFKVEVDFDLTLMS